MVNQLLLELLGKRKLTVPIVPPILINVKCLDLSVLGGGVPADPNNF